MKKVSFVVCVILLMNFLIMLRSVNEETKFLNSLPPTEREDIRCYKNADFAIAINCDLELHMNVDGLQSGFM